MMYSDDNTMKGRYSCGTATSRMGFLLLLLGMPVQAWQPQGYAALALGLSAQSIPEERSDDGESDTLLTDLVYARGGIEWIPGVSTGLVYGCGAIKTLTRMPKAHNSTVSVPVGMLPCVYRWPMALAPGCVMAVIAGARR